ncbi:MAG: glycine cleavage system aminomethyltransferase GcvT [Mucinivorans sp.]
MKTTPFTDYHIAAGAKMAPFAGYNMPIEFSGIADEHRTVREAVGLFDVSHMGEIWVKGPNALPFLQYVSSNDVSMLWDGKVQYSCLPNGKGGIVDDLLIYRVDAMTYLLVVNASNVDKDYAHLCHYAPQFDITPSRELYNASDEIAQLAVQGPLAMKLVQELCPEKSVEQMEYYTFCKTEVAGIKDAILSITGYTGSGGCEIYVANQDAPKLWKALWSVGQKYGMKNIGLGARDTLRLEMGFCLYGNDIDDSTSPLEAGLGWITKFVEGKDFVDRAAMESLKAEGISRKLVGFEMVDRGIARHGYSIADQSGNIIGSVTSGTQGPSLKKAIGMGYVATGHNKVGSEIFVIVRDKALRAQVVKMPFYKVQK